MTATVAMANEEYGNRIMQLVLPSEYGDLSKIPVPTDSNIVVNEIPPAVGAVHRYSGSQKLVNSKEISNKLKK